jgi:hypothetical protein
LRHVSYKESGQNPSSAPSSIYLTITPTKSRRGPLAQDNGPTGCAGATATLFLTGRPESTTVTLAVPSQVTKLKTRQRPVVDPHLID